MRRTISHQKQSRFKLLNFLIVVIQVFALAGSALVGAVRPTPALAQTVTPAGGGGAAPGGVSADLALWLKAGAGISAGDGAPVTTWLDQSPNGYTAAHNTSAAHQLNATNYSPPTYYASSNLLNFNPVVRFGENGNTTGLDLGSDYIFADQSGAHLFAVVRPQTSNGLSLVYDFGGVGQEGYGLGYGPGDFMLYTATNHGGVHSGFPSHSRGGAPTLVGADIVFGNEQRVRLDGGQVYNTAITLAALSATEVNENPTPDGGGGPVMIGRQAKSDQLGNNSGRWLRGDLAEVIVYTDLHTPAQVNQVESYLAVKYGITLGGATPTDYLDSAGATVWDGNANATYHNDVAGVGRDDGSALNQTASSSINPGSMITLSNPSDLQNGEFFLWGHDGGALAPVANAPAGLIVNQRLARVWKVSEPSGNVGQFASLAFDLSGVSGVDLSRPASEFYLLVSTGAANFSTATAVAASSINGSEVTFTNIGMNNGDFFTVAFPTPIAPGGVSAGIGLWLKANDGVTDSSGAVSQWVDQSGNGLDFFATVAQPTYQGAATHFNFNPYVDLDVGQYLTTTLGSTIYGTNNDPAEVFVVANSTLNGSKFLGTDIPTSLATPFQGDYPALYHETGVAYFNFAASSGQGPTALSTGQTYLFGYHWPVNGPVSLDYNAINDFTFGITFTGMERHIIGESATGDNFTDADIAEIVAFRRELAANERLKVQSYLAVKYGITLGGATPTDYLDSVENLIWDGDANGAYHNDVAGIGRDDGSALDQRMSRSINPNTLVTMNNGAAFTADGSFLLWGNDGGSTNISTTVTGLAGVELRMERIWKVQEMGAVGAVQVSISNTVAFPLAAVYLIVSDDGVFDGVGETAIALSDDGANWTASVDLTNGQYFTFGSGDLPPAPVIVAPAASSLITTTTPLISGTAQPGTTVTVYEGATILCTATVDGAGAWSCAPATPLSDGEHTITATAASGAGEGPASLDRTFTIDSIPPAAPTVTAPASGSVISDTTPTFVGTAEPDSMVTVSEDGVILCTATADSNGDWSCTPTTPLSEELHNIEVTATDEAGNVSDPTPLTVTVDMTPPVAPVVTAPADGSVISDTLPILTGAAEPNSTITVSENGVVLCTVQADSEGDWSCPLTTPLSEGPHTIMVTATDEVGNVSDPATVIFTVDTAPPAAPMVAAPVDGSVISDPLPVLTGAAEPNSTITVSENGVILCTTQTDSEGDWSCPLTTPLSEGEHTLTITVTDKAGNVSDVATLTVTVDATSTLWVWLPIVFNAKMVYSSDFSTAPGPAWSSQQRSTSPSGESFLGEFVNEGVTLTLTNLPDHERATVTFDLYIIRSWDGNQVDFPWLAAAYAALDTATLGSIGPDRWLLQAGGVTLVDTTFANIVEFRQSYPGSYPGGDNPAQNGALAVNSLGYTFGDTPMDAVYRISYTFDHSDSSLSLDFEATGLQTILEDESWGIDNVTVTVQ